MSKNKDLSNNLGDIVSKAKATLNNSTKESGGSSNEDLYGDLRRQLGEESSDYETETPTYNENIPEYDNSFDDDDYNIQEGAEPAYDGGPAKAQIEIWKKQYGTNNVFHVVIVARDFVFRPLNRLEYKTILAAPNTDATRREELICKTCVLYPPYGFEDMAVQEAGYPSSLSQIIMDTSGFSNEYNIEVL